MNEKGFTLDLFGAEVSGPSVNRNSLTPFLIVAAIILVVAAIVFLPLPASTNVTTAPANGSVDVARWEAMGEFYGASAPAAERASQASVARWEAMGDFFLAESMEANAFEGKLIDGWNRHADYYESGTSAVERPLIDGWNQHADYYEAGSSATERPLIGNSNQDADYYKSGMATLGGVIQSTIDSRAALVEYHQSHGR